MTSINQGNGTAFRSNLRVRSQSESPTLARSSCLHLAPFPARLRACRSLLLTRGSPKPSSHLLSRAMLLLSILNLASRLTSSRRVKTRSPAALPEMAVDDVYRHQWFGDPAIAHPCVYPVPSVLFNTNGAIISKRWPKRQDFATKAQIPNHHGTRKPRHRKYHRRATRRD